VEPSLLDAASVLNKLAGGQPQDVAELFTLVYKQLRMIAARHLRQERADHTLQATALVHEAYLRLVRQEATTWQSRAHFFAVVSRVMRHVLVDYGRGRQRKKRGANPFKVPLRDGDFGAEAHVEEILALDESLKRLEGIDPRQTLIVELRYFGGLSVEEIAEVLGVSAKTVKRDWSVARAWLYGQLRERNGSHREGLGENQGIV
jgi:RNA polymerase sigma factor (TIGR02999 family)